MKIPTLQTPRLTLVELKQHHLNDLFAIYSDEEAMMYWDDLPHKNTDETQKILDLLTDRIKNGSGISWGICLKGDPQKVIGTISYNRFRRNKVATIGYILAKSHWNKGLMTEALKVFIEFGFTELMVHRIEAHVEPGNTVSEAVLKQLGFQRERLLRQRHFCKNKHQDMIIYGLLKTDKRRI